VLEDSVYNDVKNAVFRAFLDHARPNCPISVVGFADPTRTNPRFPEADAAGLKELFRF
jgi:hypothetical protein